MLVYYHQNKTTMKFIIAGGGICGLTTAIALYRLGLEVVVYEAATTIKAAGAGISLSSNAIRALQAIDLAEVVIAHSQIQEGFRFFTPKGKLINEGDFNAIVTKYGLPALISFHRADLHQVLLETIKDTIPFYTNKRCQNVEQNKEEEVVLTFTDGTTAKGDYLLACDGIHSAIRKQLLPTVQPRYAGYTIWRGLLPQPPNDPIFSRPFKTFGKEGQFGAVLMKNKQLYWFASRKAPYKDAAMKAMTVDDLKKYYEHFHEPIPQILELSKDKDLIWNDAIDLKPLSQFAFGNILLMGDAAHGMTPNLGQGACQAIEDAAVLAKILKKEQAVEKAFRLFEQERIPRTTRVTNDSWNMGKAAHLENKWMINLRNFFMRITADRTLQKQIDFLNGIDF